MDVMEKNLSDAEIWYGFLRVPARFSKIFPDTKCELSFELNGNKTKLKYRPEYRRIFGLTKWYKKFKVKEGCKIKITKKQNFYEFLIV